MGTWGSKLYQDDFTQDVRDNYKEKLKDGKDNQQALKEILKDYAWIEEDDDERPLFWMALADTLWNLGRLTLEVKEEAIKEIGKGADLERWKNEGTKKEYENRKKELEALKEKLERPMPPEKKIAKYNQTSCEWKMWDTYAYLLDGEEATRLGYNGRYLIFRKVDEEMWGKKLEPIVYVQITKDNTLPKGKKELEQLEYVVLSNVGNVRHEYVAMLLNVTKSQFRQFKYIGNFKELKTPEDDYRKVEKINISILSLKHIDSVFIQYNIINLGTNINPIYYEVDIKNMSDSKIRYLMKVRYYEKVLGIIPKEDEIVKDNALLYISLVDSMMVGGIVDNPIGMRVEDMKEEAYKRIEELKEMVYKQKDTQKSTKEKIEILEDLRNRIEAY